MSFISRFMTYGTPCSPAPSSALPSATPPLSKPTGLTWLKSTSVSTAYGWWGQMVSTCNPEAKHLARESSCITGVIRSKLNPRPQNSKINTMDSVGGHRGRWWWWGHCPVVSHRCSLLPTGSGKVGGHVVSIFCWCRIPCHYLHRGGIHRPSLLFELQISIDIDSDYVPSRCAYL